MRGVLDYASEASWFGSSGGTRLRGYRLSTHSVDHHPGFPRHRSRPVETIELRTVRALETELLTIGEAAQAVRVPIGTLRYWRHLGVGPSSFRVGRRVVYRRSDLDEWLREQERQTCSSAARGYR